MIKLLTMAFMLIFTSPVFALEIGPGINTQIPSALVAEDQDGRDQNFNSLKGENGAVIVFFRSADWCPYCQTQLIDINKYSRSFEEAGYPVIAISYDKPRTLKAFAKKRAINFTLLSDADSKIINEFGIMNTEYSKNHFAYGVPHPVIYVVNTEGVIQNIYAEDGYKTRPSTNLILKDLIAE